jgi:hypothetical protein
MPNALLVAAILFSLAAVPRTGAQETSQPAETAAPGLRAHIAYLDKSKTIYIAQFETCAEARPTVREKDAPIDRGSMGNPRADRTDEESASGSRCMAQLMSDSLLHEIKRAGYRPKLLGSGDPRPGDGILVTGVFTQTGQDGLLRLAALGPGQAGGDVQLYITTSDLLRSEKPLYEAIKQGSGSDVAAVPIKLNPEIAVLAFSVARNPTEKAVKKLAEQIVAELQRLTLRAESEGLAGSGDPLNKYSKP